MTEKRKEYEFKGEGLTTTEKHQAEERFEEYKKLYHIENISDLELLSELVFREAIQIKYKKQIKRLNKSKTVKEQGLIPKHILRALDENLEQIITIKERLGLFENKKEEDFYDHFKILEKKYEKWLEENQGSRSLICPHCSHLILLKIKTTSWDAIKHPYFKDRILANEHLWQLLKEGKITKQDIVKILGCSEDYVDWLAEKLYSD